RKGLHPSSYQAPQAQPYPQEGRGRPQGSPPFIYPSPALTMTTIRDLRSSSFKCLSPVYRDFLGGWHDFGGEQVERFEIGDVLQAEDGLVNAQFGQLRQVFQQGCRGGGTVAPVRGQPVRTERSL